MDFCNGLRWSIKHSIILIISFILLCVGIFISLILPLIMYKIGIRNSEILSGSSIGILFMILAYILCWFYFRPDFKTESIKTIVLYSYIPSIIFTIYLAYTFFSDWSKFYSWSIFSELFAIFNLCTFIILPALLITSKKYLELEDQNNRKKLKLLFVIVFLIIYISIIGLSLTVVGEYDYNLRW